MAEQLSAMYAQEVPKYAQLVDATEQVNADADDATDAGRLGKERHGAIRLANFDELSQIAKLFSLYGMEAVGFYDLRTSPTPLPVVSTAFRPIDPADMAASPFRMFTSTLVADDERFFSPQLSAGIVERTSSRQLLSDELVELMEEFSAPKSKRLVELTVDAFRLNLDPIDEQWHAALDEVSPVASDIAAAAGTHLNHLTPRVADIEALHALMESRGVTMIDRIQGPPSWAGPDVLLRQTSFRALDEMRAFITADGDRVERSVRVRFGEVEQRGIALTRQGRAKVDAAMNAAKPGTTEAERIETIRSELANQLAPTVRELAANGDIYVEYHATPVPVPGGVANVDALIEAGCIELMPITYEDFLPASAAGIFASNLAHDGKTVEDTSDRARDGERLREAVGTLHDPYALYKAQQDASLQGALAALGL